MSQKQNEAITKARIYIETYGCTLNQADSDLIKGLIKANGFAISDKEDKADVIVVNTCTVKGATENKIVERLKRFTRNRKPLVVAGCLSINEKLIRCIAPYAVIVGTSSIAHIIEALKDALAGKVIIYKSREDKEQIVRSVSTPIMRIPICEGCVSNCHFCQTKLARPFLFSYAPKTIMRLIEDAVEKSAKEIQLTAMDSGVYGLDKGTNLIALLQAVCEIEGNFSIRLGMINPQHAKKMMKDLVKVIKDKRFYKFMHIPVQTGSEKVCKDMARQHTVNDFIEVVLYLRKKIPDITIATDIIVGYPTETEKDFQMSIELIENIKPDIVNLSKFSPRPGTAAKLLKQLPTNIIAKRSRELTTIIKRITREKNMNYVGKKCKVLITEKQKDFTGRSINYKQIVVKGFTGKLGDFVNVNIENANHGALFGRCC